MYLGFVIFLIIVSCTILYTVYNIVLYKKINEQIQQEHNIDIEEIEHWDDMGLVPDNRS